MRNIRVVNIIQRLNYLNKSTNLLSKVSSANSSILNDRIKRVEGACNFEQSKRHSSSSHGSSDFGRSTIVYSAIGATIFGGFLAIYNLTGEKKKTPRYSAPQETSSQQAEEPTAEPEQSEESEPEQKVEEVKAVAPKVEEKPVRKSEEPKGQASDKDKFLPEIPSYAQYLIVGGGTAAMSAFKAIRAQDPTAKVLVVTEENYKPYMRPPLSKDLWLTDNDKLVENLKFKQYSGSERSLFFLEDEFYVSPKELNQLPNGGVAVATGKKVTHVDITNKTVKLDNGWEITYGKCLIATGGKPRNLPVFEKSWDSLKDKVTLFRQVDDFKRLHEIAKQGKTVAIIGGGFLGSELACALSHASKKYGGKVIQIFPESGTLRRVLPQYLSEWTTRQLKNEGVSIVPNATISKAQLNDDKVELTLDSLSENDGPKAKWLLADHVVVAVGLEPNVQLASKSGFETDPNFGGYVVNAELQARNSVWVAGDAACFYDIKLGRRRVEHHDHAVVSGRLAGQNMTGAGKPYWHQSMFWSDLGPNIGFEAIGLIDSSLQTIGLFAKANENDTPQALVKESNEALRSETQDTNQVSPVDISKSAELRKPTESDNFGKGVILYLKNDVVVGVLLWNLFKRVPIARELIQSQEKVTDYKEIAKLFRIDASGLEEEEGN